MRLGMSISIEVALAHQPDEPAFGRFRRDMADRQARRAAGEAAVGDQRAGLAEPLRLQIAGRIEHLLHAGPAARAFVADHHHVARLDRVGRGSPAPRRPGSRRRAPGRRTSGCSRRRRPSSRCSRRARGCRCSTASPPSLEKACSALRMTPVSRSRSRSSQRRSWLNAVWVGTPPGAARKKCADALALGARRCPSGRARRRASRVCTVGRSRSIRPARSSSPRIAMMPPARWTSSM